LTITSPGNASLTRSLRMPTDRGTSQLFGVDTMAITTDGNFLYVTNPTLSGAKPVIDVVDLRTFTHVKSIGTPQHYPDPVRNWPNPPDPADPTNPSDWIEYVLPVGIAFPPKPPVAAVPAMSGWGLLLGLVLFAGAGAIQVVRLRSGEVRGSGHV
jgi:hypothetical protein